MDWDRAACRGRGVKLMFPRQYDGPPARKAIALCLTCPLCEQCADEAIERGETSGVWGGLTPDRIAAIAADRERMLTTQQGNRT